MHAVLQANQQYPVTAAGPAYPNQGLQGPIGTYPQGTYPQGTYPQGANYEYNQAYPQNTGGYNPAPASGYPVTGQPAGGYNGVQMQPLPQEKPGYQATV